MRPWDTEPEFPCCYVATQPVFFKLSSRNVGIQPRGIIERPSKSVLNTSRARIWCMYSSCR